MTFALFELLVGRRKEQISESRRVEEQKARLLRGARSTVNDVALEAIHELREHGWLTNDDGLLTGAKLQGANLAGVTLWRANLTNANLQQVKFDEHTVLPDAQWVEEDTEGNLIYDKCWIQDIDMTRYTNPEHPDFWQPEWVKQP